MTLPLGTSAANCAGGTSRTLSGGALAPEPAGAPTTWKNEPALGRSTTPSTFMLRPEPRIVTVAPGAAARLEAVCC